MSLYGVMRTSTSGMSAQAGRLATVAENIANVNTNGYKRASTEFSSLLIEECPVTYTSGAVMTDVRHAISEQGSLLNTGSGTDLAVRGQGFFVVKDASDTPYLTRAGSFVENEEGELVNAGGFKLQGYPITGNSPPVVVNGFSGLVPVDVSDMALKAAPTQVGQFTANLPSDAPVTAAGQLPATNSATAAFSGKSSLVTYDNLGHEVVIDLYFAKTAANSWQVTAYDHANASPTGGFPYSAAALTTSSLSFSGTTGALLSPAALAVAVPNGANVSLDISKMSQLATGYAVLGAKVDGNPPSSIKQVEIAHNGTCYATYDNGSRIAVFQIPLATVVSPDNLSQLTGNVFLPTKDSGDVQLGFAETAGFGSVLSGTLEQSNVDLASELTTMIDSQRGYTANSKVFQTGAELMDVLINLKR